MTTAADVIALARAKGMMIATAESCTGGLIVGALTSVPGSSHVVDRGFVTYSNAAKVEMLGVSPATLEDVGAVSEEVARQMAEGALGRSAAQLTVAVTGIAGPGGSQHKPEGLVWFALAGLGGATESFHRNFGAPGRAEVRRLTVDTALDALARRLSG